jgi:hypothetical protein
VFVVVYFVIDSVRKLLDTPSYFGWKTFEGKRPLRKPRRRGADNIRMDLRETGWEGVDWIHLAEDRNQWRGLVNTVMGLRIP